MDCRLISHCGGINVQISFGVDWPTFFNSSLSGRAGFGFSSSRCETRVASSLIFRVRQSPSIVMEKVNFLLLNPLLFVLERFRK
ncbi:hypothetical protein SUGI_0323770 [Cryptomeria japonica]|nr:hypothetical protein SUGI_0323770 [Cryptomeria japonica]